MPTEFEDVLRFWFPQQLSGDYAAMARQLEWWFRGGAHSTIIERFSSLLNERHEVNSTTGRTGHAVPNGTREGKGPPEIGKGNG